MLYGEELPTTYHPHILSPFFLRDFTKLPLSPRSPDFPNLPIFFATFCLTSSLKIHLSPHPNAPRVHVTSRTIPLPLVCLCSDPPYPALLFPSVTPFRSAHLIDSLVPPYATHCRQSTHSSRFLPSSVFPLSSRILSHDHWTVFLGLYAVAMSIPVSYIHPRSSRCIRLPRSSRTFPSYHWTILSFPTFFLYICVLCYCLK